MTQTRRLNRAGLSLVFALSIAASAGPLTGATAGAPSGEFDRITADMRASLERHDLRAFHQYRRQLDRLIATATQR